MAKKSPSTLKLHPTKKKKSKPWATRKRKVMLAIGLLLMLSAGALYGYIKNMPPQSVARHIPVFSAPTPTPEPKDTLNPLNGQLYTKTEAAELFNRRPLAVMIENHTQARPQAGLSQAEVIYEAMAEGGITRFMALYLANTPEVITPIRSARLHFVDWAAEYDALYAHWGGSNESIQFLRNNSRPKDLDQFLYAGAFYRDYSGGRSLEHTGAASATSLRQTAQANGWEQAVQFEPWQFKDSPSQDQRPDSQTLRLGFLGTRGYDATFEYQPQSNTYVRFTAGQPHLDADGQQLTASSIVLLHQQVSSYIDSQGKPAVDVQTTGNGQATVIQDGQALQAAWSKSNRNSRTQITTQNGHPIKLNRGQTIWVVSVPIGSSVSY